MPTPQNGQTHSNNLPAVSDELFDHFVGLTLEELRGANCIITSCNKWFTDLTAVIIITLQSKGV